MGITIKWLAHASFQVVAAGRNIYFDPSTKGTNLKEKDFSPADLILVSHGHDDHFDKGLIKKIRKGGSPVIASDALKKEIGFGVFPVNPGGFMQLGSGEKVIALDAYNMKRFRSPGKPFHPKGEGAGYILEVAGKKIYHAGDTDLVPEMAGLAERNIDVALLPAGDTFTMDMKEAAEAALLIKPKVAIPMHTKGADPQAFKAAVEAKSGIKAVILAPGGTFQLD
ncbi:MAG: MBL fold metallo-hydrolase [Candidatus Lokiarchaeota archaeon]|nr:MBL fold metallo-hydrolase [Candidatus Lokiarchaeota archaeon]